MKKVLIIDDNVLIIRSLVLLLQGYECEIHSAAGGDEGIHKYYSVKPDIVITDMEMPFCPGIKVIENIREHNKEQIIIAMSSREVNGKIAIESGASVFYVKPLLVEELLKYLNP